MPAKIPDVSGRYEAAKSPDPFSKRGARQAARLHFTNIGAGAWAGFVFMRLRRAGKQIVLVKIERARPKRLNVQGVVRMLHTTDLRPGMRVWPKDTGNAAATVLSARKLRHDRGKWSVRLRVDGYKRPVVFAEGPKLIWPAAIR